MKKDWMYEVERKRKIRQFFTFIIVTIIVGAILYIPFVSYSYMIKSYTNLDQSKKLAEILSLESADMYYGYGRCKPEFLPYSYVEIKELCLPCWSLAVLRNLLPAAIKVNENTYLFESHNTFDKCWVYRYYNEDDVSYLYCKDTNEVDACVSMIEKLRELKML